MDFIAFLISGLFSLSAAVVVYVIFLYPALVCTIANRMRRNTSRGEELKSVTVIVPFYNEANGLGEKIENCLALDYPAGQIDILFVSDGSTDGGENLVKACEDPRVRRLEFTTNRGKSAALNEAVADAKGEIIVFSDVGAKIEPAAMKSVIPHFHDDQVGCVCGMYRGAPAAGNEIAKATAGYLGFEMQLRAWESETWTAVGGTGAFLAMRRRDFAPLSEGLLNDDFVLAARLAAAGKRVIYEPEACVDELSAPELKKILRRRARISYGNWQMLSCLPRLRHWRSRFAVWVFVSHKLLRMILPAPLFILWVGLGISSPALFWLLTISLAVLLALGGLCLRVNPRLIEGHPLGTIPLILLSFGAVCVGTLRYFRRGAIEW
jgi:cellulose synthase/poly-beta-1,6-N-acetylglucosamine synthase-like glycosyltransferase